jgi:hypothetical protein
MRQTTAKMVWANFARHCRDQAEMGSQGPKDSTITRSNMDVVWTQASGRLLNLAEAAGAYRRH